MENESRRKDVSILIILLILFFLLVQVSSCFNSNQGNSLSGDNENPVPPDEYKNNPDRKSKEIISFPESIKTYTIGESVKGMPLTVTEIGLGNKTGLVITGAIHGSEKNTKIQNVSYITK